MGNTLLNYISLLSLSLFIYTDLATLAYCLCQAYAWLDASQDAFGLAWMHSGADAFGGPAPEWKLARNVPRGPGRIHIQKIREN